MTAEFHRICDDLVRAAMAEDQAFSDLLPRMMGASQQVPVTELTAAMPRLAEGIAQAPPNLGGTPLVERLTEVTAASLAFGKAWEEATGNPPPDMENDQPSQEVLDTV